MGVQAILARDPFASVGDTFPTFARAPRIACLRKAQLRPPDAVRDLLEQIAHRPRQRGQGRLRIPCGAQLLGVARDDQSQARERRPRTLAHSSSLTALKSSTKKRSAGARTRTAGFASSGTSYRSNSSLAALLPSVPG